MTSAGGSEAVLETAGVTLGLGIFLARLIHRRVGQAHDHAPNCSQHSRCFGGAHSALILLQRDVQAMVQSAFNDPVTALEGKHSLGLQLLECETAQQINDLSAPFALTLAPVPALDPCLQSGR